MKRIFFARLHHTMKIFISLKRFSKESRWLFFPFSTIDSTTAKPKLKSVNKVTFNFDQGVLNADQWESIAQ